MYLYLAYIWVYICLFPSFSFRARVHDGGRRPSPTTSIELHHALRSPSLRLQTWCDAYCSQGNVGPCDKRQVYTIPFSLTFLLYWNYLWTPNSRYCVRYHRYCLGIPLNSLFSDYRDNSCISDIISWSSYIVLHFIFCISLLFMHATNLYWYVY